MAAVMKGAEPWGSEGDQVGVLMLHGFTGSPQTVRGWAEAVAAQGRTVLLPRLPGHGTSVDDLAKANAKDWAAEAEMSFRGLQERCHTVFVCGISFGGALALDLAARYPDRVAGLVLVNPAVFTTNPLAKLAPLLGRLPLQLKGVANDIADPAGTELAYAKMPTKAAAEVLRFQADVKARLGRVKAPLLVYTSRNDHVVEPPNSAYIVEHVSSEKREQVWLDRSFHVATLDFDKDLIFEGTNKFIQEHSE